MALQTVYSNAAARAALDAITAQLNAISTNNGVIKIFTGSPPVSTETADSGTLLADGLTLSATAFGASVDNGVGGATATANAIAADPTAAADGVAGYFRAYNYDGATYTCVIQGSCGTTGTDMILNTTNIVAGSQVQVVSWSLVQPDGSGVD